MENEKHKELIQRMHELEKKLVVTQDAGFSYSVESQVKYFIALEFPQVFYYPYYEQV